MPLSAFLRKTRGKRHSDHQIPCPVDFPTRVEDGLFELVWENGQIVMQGQSSRVNKNATHHSSPSTNTPKFLNAVTNSRITKFSEVDSILNDLSPVVPSAGDMNLSQDDDMVPWMNYPVDLPHYYAESLHEISGVTANGMSNQNSFALKHMKSGCNQNSSDLPNFSHFSRPAAKEGAAKEKKMEIKENGLTVASNNIVKSSLVDRSAPTRPSRNEGKTANICGENSIKNENPQARDSPIADSKKEHVVASSVGSGNSGYRVSSEQVHNSKRKFRDIEDSVCNDDDVKTESAGFRKTNSGYGGNGSKRGRAAEEHNLSERRRRDRINEKMRSLQELIPNSNKGDKASMLDEAIEYLKTLQFQVQMMSMGMGSGLCMAPMMFPSGIHPAHLPQFPPMGFGMGMGFGLGMGMLDMNVGSSSYPPIPTLPQMLGLHFTSQMLGPANFPKNPTPNLYAHHPSEGLHPVSSSLPVAPLAVQPPVTSAIESEPNKNPQLVHNSSINQNQTTNEVLDKSVLLLKKRH